MKPMPPPNKNPQQDLFRSELEQIIDTGHPLLKLAKTIDWEHLDEVFGENFSPDCGRPAISTRLMVSLHYLKYSQNLSDERVVGLWTENPYWQYLSGMKFFTHKAPIDASSMTRWRHRVGESGAEELLKATIDAGKKLKAVKASQLARVNIDTTVQEKGVRFPTDTRLYFRARERLVKEADKRGIALRQNYNRKSKVLFAQQSRYAHARQFSCARACTKKLRTYLGCVIRDIERKCPVPDERLSWLLNVSKRIFVQRRSDKDKVYSVHEPAVACISKGKAHKRYEFGSKVSVAVTSKGGWVVGVQSFSGNPYDGHTLSSALSQVSRMGVNPVQAFADMGYRGHGYVGSIEVHVAKRRRGVIPVSVWRVASESKCLHICQGKTSYLQDGGLGVFVNLFSYSYFSSAVPL